VIEEIGEDADVPVASGGTITFDAGREPEAPTNELFAEGRYTDYGLALGSDRAAADGSAGTNAFDESIGDAEIAPKPQERAQPAGTETNEEPDGSSQSAAHSAIAVEPVVALEDLNLRGSDGLL
jgi:hypothetical protein